MSTAKSATATLGAIHHNGDIVVYHLVPRWDDHGKAEGYVIEAQQLGAEHLLPLTPELDHVIQQDIAHHAAKATTSNSKPEPIS